MVTEGKKESFKVREKSWNFILSQGLIKEKSGKIEIS